MDKEPKPAPDKPVTQLKKKMNELCHEYLHILDLQHEASLGDPELTKYLLGMRSGIRMLRDAVLKIQVEE